MHRKPLVAERSNPQTGPFYVEGAEPGDTLVVELLQLRPNRSYGFTGTMVAPNVVDPAYAKAAAGWLAYRADLYDGKQG